MKSLYNIIRYKKEYFCLILINAKNRVDRQGYFKNILLISNVHAVL